MPTFASMFISVVFVGMLYTASARSFRPDDRYTRIFPDNTEDAQRNYRNAKALMVPELYNPEEDSMMPHFEHHESGDAENEISNELDSDSPHGEEGHMHDEEGHSHGEEGHSHGEEGHSHDEDGHSLHGDVEMDSSDEGEDDDESGFKLPGIGFLLGNPILSLKFVNDYFVKLERALETVFRESLAEAMNDMNAFTNTTNEVVDIDGQKYKVRKTLVKKGDENSSVLIETMASELLANQTEVPKES